ncbi:hypothetical protein FSP39_011700 [Pinctada imbricata]|uniref:Sushi domain-containing protein n=1 Tax=Pinctada imbricata TaxID=66713 RepID=A0AA88YCF6_PINIB|nr:hypothetical protein FSP39_011700 [Pinctada imbricata]
MTDSYNCSDPSSLTDGFFVIAKSYYVHGDKVYYYCKQNFYLEGNPIRECSGYTGNWTGSSPTCTAEPTTATTTTTEATSTDPWVYMSAGLSGFLALFLILCLIAIIIRFCVKVCRQTKRKMGNQEEIVTGCCFFCCTDCENACKKHIQKIEKKKYRSAGIQSMIDLGPPPPAVHVPRKVAVDVPGWKPSKNPYRPNNTSTN